MIRPLKLNHMSTIIRILKTYLGLYHETYITTPVLGIDNFCYPLYPVHKIEDRLCPHLEGRTYGGEKR